MPDSNPGPLPQKSGLNSWSVIGSALALRLGLCWLCGWDCDGFVVGLVLALWLGLCWLCGWDCVGIVVRSVLALWLGL